MAVYKVIQDIESEDKLLGPLTLKGFIYAAIAGISIFVEFKLLFIASPIKWLFILIFAFPMILFGVLASPLGREQPTEVWLLSRIRFFLKPRSRIWDQEGVSQHVTVTVPKKVEVRLTKDLTPGEVQSRLKTLATTLDTRGWAIKNVDVNLSSPDTDAAIVTPTSDRLVNGAGVPGEMPVVDVHAADDILDEKNNPTAKKFDSMMKQAEVERKHNILSALKAMIDGDETEDRTRAHPRKRRSHKSTKDLASTKAAMSKIASLSEAAKAKLRADEEAETADKIAKARSQFNSLFVAGRKKSNPTHHLVDSSPPATNSKASTTPVTPVPQAVNMNLAQSGSAFSVATLSKLANRQSKVEQTGPDEITISLH